jgi:Glycosyl hydrolase family 26
MRIYCLLLTLIGGYWVQAQEQPSDKRAAPAVRRLYNNMKKLTAKGYMFGHQDDLAYGVNWKYIPGNSDIREVVGDYPAVYGWELGNLELDSTINLDGVPFAQMKQFIAAGYQRGAVITISWHFTNAVSGKSAWDTGPGVVAAILPGGEKNGLYKSWLNKLAVFLLDLKDAEGQLIPVIFRPFHELNGSWFWWGRNFCTPDEIKALYRYTVSYLRDTKQLHHLLYAFNTDRFSTEAEYLERYPGDEWVDIIGFDIYQRNTDNARFINDVDKSLTVLDKLAGERSKIAALTEFGYGGLPDSSWWTTTFLPAIGTHRIAYALAWRNAGRKADGSTEFYVPYSGHASAQNFRLFYADKRTLFQKDIEKEKLYQ